MHATYPELSALVTVLAEIEDGLASKLVGPDGVLQPILTSAYHVADHQTVEASYRFKHLHCFHDLSFILFKQIALPSVNGNLS